MNNPRVLRHKDAPSYIGVNQNYFNEHVRPLLTEVRLGPQMICFDRKELDAYVDTLFEKERIKKAKSKKEERKCEKPPASSKEVTSGGSTNKSEVDEFRKAREQLISKKRKGT